MHLNKHNNYTYIYTTTTTTTQTRNSSRGVLYLARHIYLVYLGLEFEEGIVTHKS